MGLTFNKCATGSPFTRYFNVFFRQVQHTFLFQYGYSSKNVTKGIKRKDLWLQLLINVLLAAHLLGIWMF